MTTPDPEILVVGEALVDVVAGHRFPGGSPANVAVGLGRLGRSVRLVTQLGADADGELIRDHLNSAGVDVHAHPTSTGRTSTAVAELDADGSAAYSFDLEWTLGDSDLNSPATPAAIHVGSIAALLEPGAAAVERFVAEHRDRALISYDPNLRPALLDDVATVRPRVERLVAAADVVKASDEDLGWLYPSGPLDEVARNWVMSGPRLVVVTRGSDGVLVVHGTEVLDVPVPDVEVRDTVGAGDAFMAGLIDGLLATTPRSTTPRSTTRGSITGIVHRAVAVAAITVSRPGADPPTAAELAAYLGRT